MAVMGTIGLRDSPCDPAVTAHICVVSVKDGMALATTYASSELLGASGIDIPAMFPIHGTANGFGLRGLLFWIVDAAVASKIQITRQCQQLH